MSGIFDAVREIPCIDAAEKLGWRLKQHGRRAWTQCPFHGEKTASLCLYEGDRGFYCFGCHEGGDVVRLYEKALGVSPVQAATQLAADFGITAISEPVKRSRAPSEYNLRRALEKKQAERYRELTDLRWEADARLAAMARRVLTPEDMDRHYDLIRSDFDRVRAVGGTFLTLSHYYAMTGEWTTGLRVYERLFEYARSLGDVRFVTVSRLLDAYGVPD